MNLSRTHTFVGLTLLSVFVFAGYNRWTVSSQTTQARCGNGICEASEREIICPPCVPGGNCACSNRCPQDCSGTTRAGQPTCSDTDGGRNLSVRGTVSAVNAKGTRASRSDTCLSSGSNRGKLVEYSCNGTTPRQEVVSCPSGTTCREGACVSGSGNTGGTGGQGGTGGMCPPCVPPPHPSCKGTGPCGCGPYVCPPSTNPPPPASGMMQRCNDTDRGQNFARPGIVTLKNGTVTQMRDFCMTGVMQGVIAEFYCNADDRPARVLHRCLENLCTNGRCTRESSNATPPPPRRQPLPGGPCAPIQCDDGTSHPRCTPEGHQINYFADPCRYN